VSNKKYDFVVDVNDSEEIKSSNEDKNDTSLNED